MWRLSIFRPSRQTGDRGLLPPLRHRLRVNIITLGQSPQAIMNMMYRSTERPLSLWRCRVNLAHGASFHWLEKTAPSKFGIKHPGGRLTYLGFSRFPVEKELQGFGLVDTGKGQIPADSDVQIGQGVEDEADAQLTRTVL